MKLPKELAKDTPRRPVKYETRRKTYEGEYSVTDDESMGIVIHVWCRGFYECCEEGFGPIPPIKDNLDFLARNCLERLVKDQILPGQSA